MKHILPSVIDSCIHFLSGAVLLCLFHKSAEQWPERESILVWFFFANWVAVGCFICQTLTSSFPCPPPLSSSTDWCNRLFTLKALSFITHQLNFSWYSFKCQNIYFFIIGPLIAQLTSIKHSPNWSIQSTIIGKTLEKCHLTRSSTG